MRRAIFRKLVKLFTKPNEYLIDGLSISEQFKVNMIQLGISNEWLYEDLKKNLKECKSPNKYKKALKKDAKTRFDDDQSEEEKHHIDENERLKDIIFAVRY